jgi:hypothetical protein
MSTQMRIRLLKAMGFLALILGIVLRKYVSGEPSLSAFFIGISVVLLTAGLVVNRHCRKSAGPIQHNS